MGHPKEFCTCKDYNYPLHPVNHDKGCSLCIEKNLKSREIPSCFFNTADEKYTAESYRFEDFAKLILQKE